jgi:hypothetical protein
MSLFTSSGSWDGTERFLRRISDGSIFRILDQYGREGVEALKAATPVDSSLTAQSWNYEVILTSSSASIVWTNVNVVDGTPVAILLQYGHGTGTGGYVQGRDYINPAIRPIFDRISNDVWKAVTSG